MNGTTMLAVRGALALAALALCADVGFAQVTIGSGNTSATNNTGLQQGGIGNIQNGNVSNQRSIQRTTTTISGTGNSTVNQNAADPGRNVPTVFAPGLAAAGSEVCLGSVSGGGSGSGFGVTIGGTFVDRECQLRLNARTLATLGYPVAARETMCLDEDVRRAMYAAGTPCAVDRAGWAGYGGWGGWHASAESSTQYAAAPASQSVAASRSVASSPRGYASQAPDPAPAPAPASESVAASPPASTSLFGSLFGALSTPSSSSASESVAASPAASSPSIPSSTSGDPNCQMQYQLIGGWYNPCPEKKVSENEVPAPTAKPKKHTAKAKQSSQTVAATPTTASTKVASGAH